MIAKLQIILAWACCAATGWGWLWWRLWGQGALWPSASSLPRPPPPPLGGSPSPQWISCTWSRTSHSPGSQWSYRGPGYREVRWDECYIDLVRSYLQFALLWMIIAEKLNVDKITAWAPVCWKEGNWILSSNDEPAFVDIFICRFFKTDYQWRVLDVCRLNFPRFLA